MVISLSFQKFSEKLFIRTPLGDCFCNSCIMRNAYHCIFEKNSEVSNLKKPKYTIYLVFDKNTAVSLLDYHNIYGHSFSFQQILDQKFLQSFIPEQNFGWQLLEQCWSQTCWSFRFQRNTCWHLIEHKHACRSFSFSMIIEWLSVMYTWRFT